METSGLSTAINKKIGRATKLYGIGRMKAPQKDHRDDTLGSSASDGEGSTHSESSHSSLGGHIESFSGIHIISELNLPESPIIVQSPQRTTKGSREQRVPLDPSRFNMSLNLPENDCIKEEDEESVEDGGRCIKDVQGTTEINGFVKEKLPPPKESLLLRLFESKLLDASIAITHLYTSKEPGVQSYIGKC